MTNGYIKLHRSFKDWYGSKDPKRTSLWVHLLLLVNHEPHKWLFKGKPYNVDRGQCITSRISLSFITGISESYIERLLTEFQNEGQIKQQSSNRNRLITIVNYNNYQSYEQQRGQQKDNRKTSERQQKDTNKNDKKNKEVYTRRFEEIWVKYPAKDGKKQSLSNFLSSVQSDQGWDNIQTALKKYMAHLGIHTWKKPKNGSTWFNNWQDWVNWKEESAGHDISTNKKLFRQDT